MRVDRAVELASIVVRTMLSAGLSHSELVTGEIKFTDLSWQCLPLITKAEIADQQLDTVLAYSSGCQAYALYDWWADALEKLHEPGAPALDDQQGYKGLSRILINAPVGERLLRFSVPEGWPDVHPVSGIMLSMEVAQVAFNTFGGAMHIDEENFYVETDAGDIGVRDGLPAVPSPWKESAAGDVAMLSETSRGRIRRTCHYDIFAKLRSCLYENDLIFEQSFVGLDYALQALERLSAGFVENELLSAINSMRRREFSTRQQITAVEESLAYFDQWYANDRIKMMEIAQILVPTVYTDKLFNRQVVKMEFMPSYFTPKQEARIKETLLAKQQELINNLDPNV